MLTPVGTRLHGENHYMVDKAQFDEREEQVYGLVAEVEMAREKAEEDQASLARVHADLAKTRASYEALMGQASKMSMILEFLHANMGSILERAKAEHESVKAALLRIGRAER